ncbi:receptor-mediated endocytosis protein 6 homolog isoform X2 [Rhagoletis pomonella]|uniref:receptor-mediated endocytosis protein 6 homolog isoform X2 n=1 Tax=Rhagoletis pomonella TaxID=28610 RepID=UPI001785FFDA|nr:receptor-mediated endocytosis protein 6 homolog isoform X2 [Rhagoletis pomonella]
MEQNSEDNLLEIMDLARTLRQEQLFIQQEQAAFGQFTESLSENSTAITKLAYICAQQRQNLNDLITSRPEVGPSICCRRAKNYENAKYIDAKKVLDYEHAISYEELFNHLYRSPYLLALSLATGDRIAEITPQHLCYVIHTISAGLYGNAINTKDVEMILKLLRELIEIQIVVSENPRNLLRANSSAFARLYHRLNESMFSAKIFLTAALFEPIMGVLSDIDSVLDVDPSKVVENFSSKERLKRFGAEDSNDYQDNVNKFHHNTITKLHALAKSFIDSLAFNWSLFPSTLRWLVQTMSHQLKQSHFSDKIINEIITDMVFTHFICPAIVSPDIMGIIDAPIPEQVRFNLIQIGQIIQMLALAKHDDIDAKFAQIYTKFEANSVSNLIDLLLMSQSGEDVVAILSQQSDFDRSRLLSTQSELAYFVEFYRILMANDEFDPPPEDRQKLQKILSHLPESKEAGERLQSSSADAAGSLPVNGETGSLKERSKQGFMGLSKATKSKIAKSMSFNTNNTVTQPVTDGAASASANVNGLMNGGVHASSMGQAYLHDNHHPNNGSAAASSNTSMSSNSSSPIRAIPSNDVLENEPILVFSIYNGDEHKLQPLTEEEVLKMNCIGQDISNGEVLLVDTGSVNLDNTIDKSSSVANGFDGMDNMSDVLRPLHSKTTRFSLSHDDASIGNSDNLEAVSEAPSNHSVTSSLELEEENDQNDNLSDMVSANVSGRGTPNISGRDTPSSQVTDGESVHNALPTPQMQKLISKARSDIEDKFCKFEIKKFEGDETVSIISDTWSTDVLASDSETVDATERERDRNFSTPLIPSAVVLPGDNNFDVLASAGAMRPAFLDVSDQRSESNWSTDVLASDSEKFAEVDTDDNVSITAKSDITDSGARSEQERDQLAAAISAPQPTRRTSNSPHYSARTGRGFRTSTAGIYNSPISGNSGSPALGGCINRVVAPIRKEGNADVSGGVGGGSHGSGSSDHSQDDSAFYDAANLYDEAAAAVKVEQDAADSAPYGGLSSLARSSVRTSYQYSGENNFQQEYKSSSCNSDSKETFLGAPHMRRQTSAESSISNQSVTFEDAASAACATASKPPKPHHKSGMKKKKQHNNNAPTLLNSSPKDLIDFSDFGEEEKPSLPSREPPLVDLFGEENVEHRHTTSEARNAGFDGRRNGIMAMTPGEQTESAGVHSSVPVMRRHQSLNYENHEIMISNVVNASKRVTMIPTVSQTDDDKSQQQEQIMLLCVKTEKLQLHDADSSSKECATNPSTSRAILSNSLSGAAVSMSSCQKPTKSTGAIPKSISFDASADKNSSSHNDSGAIASTSTVVAGRHLPSHRNARVLYPNLGSHTSSANNHSGIFNKLKQGIFKHRRGNKSHSRHSSNLHNGIENTVDGVAGGDYTPHTTSNRSVSFSANTSEISLEVIGVGSSSDGARNTPLTGAEGGGAGGMTANYCDMSEDILAKYRRKVSSSSEATNSDSMGNCLAGAAAASSTNDCKHSDVEPKSPSALLHDKTLAFNVIKKKIRTVLSKTDLHTGDFRHTTYTNASPLLTYLQIQLAQALNLQNFQQISYVSEAIRCISTLERSQHTQLLEELQQDIQKRQNYLQYLMRYRQNLLLMMENIEQFETRLRSESATCNRYLMTVCVRLFFEKRQAKVAEFQEEFARLTVSDDKIELIEEFIDGLMEELLMAGGILHGMPEWQAQEARLSIERILLTLLYQQVMFPNEDADLSRDTVLSEHIAKLQRVISPAHPALCIPQVYLSEAPWSFAQQQLSYISAYKTPREKLQCVIRCISSIMSLLHMSSGRVPAADDILPVLIYVVIMTNPPFLLSTVEYITCFIGDKLEGEEQFHWTLFGSVVKFIKTMDYLD